MGEGKGLHIRGVDPDLIRRVKVQAAREGVTLRWFVIRELEHALRGKGRRDGERRETNSS
jgi:hypothetical protein